MSNPLDRFFNLLKEIGTQRRYQVAFGLWFGGLIMIATSLVLEKYVGLYLLWIVLAELGITCIIAAVAEFILLEHVKEIFLEEVRQDNDIVRHCLEHQLIDVMPPSREELNLSLQDINSTVRGPRSEVRIIAFTLQDVLPNEFLLHRVLKRQLDNDERVTLKLLLVDPASPAAKIRVMAEEGPQITLNRSQLSSRLRLSIDAIQELKERARDLQEFKIEAGFCNVLPNFYMISTPNDLFIEPYHLGYKSRGHSGAARRSPLLRFSSKSDLYQSANLHFEYLWKHFEHGSATGSEIYVKGIDEVERRRAPRRSKAVPADAEKRLASERRLRKAS